MESKSQNTIVEEDGLRNISSSKNSRLTIDIAASAIFGAISLVLSLYVVRLLPRVAGWEIAFFDPVSLIWITAYLIFGFRTGLITTVVGTFGLMLFDPTGWIGPVMKFSATIWFITMPELIRYLDLKKGGSGNILNQPKKYMIAQIFAWVIRLPVMIGLNVVILRFMGWYNFLNLNWLGIESATPLTAIVVTVVILNTIQSIGDALFPYYLVIKTSLKDTSVLYAKES